MTRLLVGIVLVGCGPTVDPSTCGDALPVVALTPGQDTTVDLADGDEIMMVHGPQGGWHVEVGLRVTDPDPRITLDLSVDALGEQVVFNHYEMRLTNHDGCTGVREGLFGFLDMSALAQGDADTPPELLVGEELTVTAEVTGQTGTATTQVVLLGVPDPKDVAD